MDRKELSDTMEDQYMVNQEIDRNELDQNQEEEHLEKGEILVAEQVQGKNKCIRP